MIDMKCKCGMDYRQLANFDDMGTIFRCKKCSRKFKVCMDEDSSCGERLDWSLEELEEDYV